MKKCEICKRVYDDSQSFCLDDGTPLIVDQLLHTAETVVMRQKKSKMPLIFFGLTVLLGIGIITGWLVLRSMYANADGIRASSNIQTTFTPGQQISNTESPTRVQSPSPPPSATNTTNINAVATPAANTDVVSVSNTAESGDPTKLPPAMKTEDHSVLFNLHQCRKSGSSITCDFTFTNKGPDRKFQFVIDRSNLFDELGNTYNGRNGQLANKEGGEPQITFVSGVTTRGQMTFEGIQPNASKITLLRIQYDVGDDYGLEVKFRSVPLLMPK